MKYGVVTMQQRSLVWDKQTVT